MGGREKHEGQNQKIGNTGRSVRQSMQAKQIRKKQRNKNIVYKGIMFDGANDRPYLNTN